MTDPRASPTGYPFKLVEWSGSSAELDSRERICDLGYLRTAYLTPAGKIDYRCASEPVDDYIRKGGDPEDPAGRRCLCNGLMANIGMGQLRTGGHSEPALLTSGDDLTSIATFLAARTHYTAAEVITALLEES